MLQKKISITPSEIFAFSLGVLILLLYYLNSFFNLENTLMFTGLGLLSTFCLVMVMKYKQSMLLGLSFIIPLSISTVLPGGAEISTPSELICILLSAFFLIKILTGVKISRKLVLHPITLLLLLDLAWLLTSSFTSEMPMVSFKRLAIKILYYISFYFFYFELFSLDKRNISRVFLLQCTGLLIPIFSSLAFHSTLGFSTMGSQQACRPFYNDHTMYGAILAFFLPFLFINSFANYNRGKLKALYIFLLLIFIVAVYLSYSRAAWLTLLVAMIVSVFLRLNFKLRHFAILIIAGSLLVIFNLGVITNYFSRSKELSHGNDVTKHLKSVSNINSDASNLERINRWKCAYRMFKDKPFFGFGPGTYQFFYGNYQVRQDLTRISTFSGTKGHAHSEYLNYLSETGWPGLIIFMTIITVVFYLGIQAYKRANSLQDKDALLFIILGLATFYVHAFFNGFLEFDKLAMPVYSSIAAITYFSITLKKTNLNR